jgi:UDP-N-acetylmuramyl pentapeptide phosphotransferase/UDP-N-acetylglucosamine-1-phosphate transferase
MKVWQKLFRPKKAISRAIDPDHSSSAETIIGFAVLGLLAAGFVGISKALNMNSGLDVLLCLLGSVIAFGAVIYIYFSK